ncbi:flavodoxin family protein [Pectinatus haikarae]|uniref:Multimeric flavodoxin WrbA n=1 Tax=Pectinatus haikarae TaxID=349096 RepID=A0ABT9Y453_9FIRM|nr:flavodoxin family protein [Pectinatus haikarae]MDQ0202610.1 multimeric flavodoxin WrbA [Pectinatus haikarae]
MKKIVVLTGSSRRNGNSNTMADCLIAAIKERENEVKRFDTAFLKIEGCRVCDTCFSKGTACSFTDDFNHIAESILAADIVVFVSPVYWYTFPAKLKAVIDKFYSFCVGEQGIGNKKCALITCCEENQMETFTGIKFSYEKMIGLLKWESVGEIMMPGVLEIGAIKNINYEKPLQSLAVSF